MFQLAYISTSRTDLSKALLEDILSVSRRNNAGNDVTGLLATGGRRFLQVLEGPEQAVLATYARIHNDDRHRGLVMLSAKAVDVRAFGTWSMASRDFDGGTDIEAKVAALVGTIPDRNLRAQFIGFASLHSQAA